jgi:hypothetical protein
VATYGWIGVQADGHNDVRPKRVQKRVQQAGFKKKVQEAQQKSLSQVIAAKGFK